MVSKLVTLGKLLPLAANYWQAGALYKVVSCKLASCLQRAAS